MFARLDAVLTKSGDWTSIAPLTVRSRAWGMVLAAAAGCAGCADGPREAPAPQAVVVLPAESPPATGTAAATRSRGPGRWVAADWRDLPGWPDDRLGDAWGALLRSCERPTSAWSGVCADARAAGPLDEAALRAWLERRLQPYRIEAGDGSASGLATGYFEPLVDASRVPRGAFRIPLYLPPADLAGRKPYWTRQQIASDPVAQQSLRGRELAYVADPLDALVLQVQGSGRLFLTEADGSRKLVRIAFAGHNDQPYRSVGRWLIDHGELKPDAASWPAIKAWAQLHPERIDELLWSNPRVVFFREEALPDALLGPRGAQGVALTPGRSVAVDPLSIPYGTPVWLDTTEPLTATPLRRLAVAQDTGSAITGGVRVDYFWGWGDTAEQQAGRMKQALRLWALWPRQDDTFRGN